MSYLLPAQASDQLLSLIVFGAIARWYAVPWLKRRPRADSLIGLLWLHVFRYVALQVFSAQRDGFPMTLTNVDAAVRSRLEALIEGRPQILVHNGRLFDEVLCSAKLTHHELNAALRESGCANVSEVQAAILENNGSISVLPKSGRQSDDDSRKHSS